jgi:short-subunit dehydrogenase
MTPSLPAVLITGASSGIGAVYADRFARRGHDLVLVARNRERLNGLAERLRSETGVRVEVVQADLGDPADLARVEALAAGDERIGILVNNAGVATGGTFAEQEPDKVTAMIALNVTAPTRLSHAVTERFLAKGSGAIINIASVVGLAPEFGMSVYGATKSFVLALSQAMQSELGPKGVYVQAVLPARTRTEIWDHVGVDANTLEGLMEVGDLVDAALAGFDRREAVTIPPLPDVSQWQAFEAARKAMMPNYRNSQPAARYLAADAPAG